MGDGVDAAGCVTVCEIPELTDFYTFVKVRKCFVFCSVRSEFPWRPVRKVQLNVSRDKICTPAETELVL